MLLSLIYNITKLYNVNSSFAHVKQLILEHAEHRRGQDEVLLPYARINRPDDLLALPIPQSYFVSQNGDMGPGISCEIPNSRVTVR
jgi:hypothetical protein